MVNNYDKKRIAKTIIVMGVPVVITSVSYAIFKKPLVLEIGFPIAAGGAIGLILDDFIKETNNINKYPDDSNYEEHDNSYSGKTR